MLTPIASLLFLVCIGAPLQAQQASSAEARPTSEATKPLALTADQKRALESIEEAAKRKAESGGLKLAGTVRQVYENMLSDFPDEAKGQRLGADMKEAMWELLSIKGESIRDSVQVLTPQQKAKLRAEIAKPDAPSDLTELIRKLF
jgi:Spy/CpxP family protein refolding chaperone